MSARGALRGLVFSSTLAATASAVAASFGLSPTGLSIGLKEQSGSVVVTNTGTDEVAIQVRPYVWSQGGQENRAETRDLLVNPPIFKLAAGEQQLVRVASRVAPLRDVERAYRVVFSEIPPQGGAQSGFRITVAMDIPVYVQPVQAAVSSIAWRRQGGNLIAENAGGAHFRVRDVQFLDGTQVVHAVPRIVVLARSWLQIELPDGVKQVRSLRLTGQDDADQPVAIDVPVATAQ
jgi:P pilus assembly chaperone PapD